MALSALRKQQARKYLGWSGRYHQIVTELENALNAVNSTGADPEYQADIEQTLDQLLAVDKQLIGSAGSAYADGAKKRQQLTKAEEVSFAGPQEMAALPGEAAPGVRTADDAAGPPLPEAAGPDPS